MKQTHDDGGIFEDDEWVYYEPEESTTRESDESGDTEPTEPRIAVSKYLPQIEYDSEKKSISITTRL
jgi:hypothetical protein